MSNVVYNHNIQKLKAKEDATVRQDKNAAARERMRLEQPASPRISVRTQHLNTKNTQSQNETVPKRRTVCISLWVEPIVRSELKRRAERNGLSISTTGGALLKRGLQQSIDMEYGALLEPVIRQQIKHEMRNYSSRIALLLVRVAFASEQTRSLVTNVLGRQPGVNPDILDHLLDSSADAAKAKITAKTPQLESILTEVERWFTEKLEEKEG